MHPWACLLLIEPVSVPKPALLLNAASASYAQRPCPPPSFAAFAATTGKSSATATAAAAAATAAAAAAASTTFTATPTAATVPLPRPALFAPVLCVPHSSAQTGRTRRCLGSLHDATEAWARATSGSSGSPT
eukprot:5945296-Pleurochrysis_carterae.AAC.1